jgi:two-component system OmpR family response regulator
MPTPEILVVDDDPRLRELVRYSLDRAGFRVREAGDGRAALQAVAAAAPDLVLLDVKMPEMDGIEVCRQLRKDREIPIIFLSTLGEEVDRVRGLELGGDDYVTKPFLPNELVSRVRAVLRRTRPAAPAETLESGAVRLDLRAHRCHVDGVEVVLTATEFRILAALLQDPGRLLDRPAMIRAAYGGPHHVSNRTLDSHIRGVRAGLGAHADRLETVPAVGWRWR